ncbi:MAG: retention module-containing protein, partial [Desulfobacterales bacterium]|nr:retention module-containing protein [Desulfobacterales bacterium]
MATAGNTTGTETGNQVVGTVVILYGNVKDTSSDGTERLLTLNSPIFAHDRIITESDGRVSIVIDDGVQSQIDLGRMSDVVIDEDIFQGASPEEVAEATAEVEQIQEALLAEDFDPTLELEAAAAGGDASAGGGSTLPDFVRVAPDVE